MTDFKIGDVVRLKTDEPGRLPLIVRDVEGDFLQCSSECQRRRTTVHFPDAELINRPDPQADLKQAIREVLLSDEFMTKFAAAFRSQVVSQHTVSGEVRSLEHPIPGVNQPTKSSEPTKAQQLADRTLKAIWQESDGGTR